MRSVHSHTRRRSRILARQHVKRAARVAVAAGHRDEPWPVLALEQRAAPLHRRSSPDRRPAPARSARTAASCSSWRASPCDIGRAKSGISGTPVATSARMRKRRADAAENRLVRDAVAVDAALLPEIVHAEVGHDADQRRRRLAPLLQIRSHRGGNHLRADDHVRREATDAPARDDGSGAASTTSSATSRARTPLPARLLAS